MEGLEAEAQEARKGLWADSQPVPLISDTTGAFDGQAVLEDVDEHREPF